MRKLKLILPAAALLLTGWLPNGTGSVGTAIPAVTVVQSKVQNLTFNEDFAITASIPSVSYPNWKTNFYFCDQTNTIAGLASRSYSGPESVGLDSVFVAATGGDAITAPNASGGQAHIAGALMSTTNNSLYGAATICAGGLKPYYAGILNTQGKFAQTYGYFEMSATLPHSANDPTACNASATVPVACGNGVPGSWPAFWLIPNTVTSANGGNFPEVDVFEHWGGQWIISSVNAHPNASLSWIGGIVTGTTSSPHGITVNNTFKLTVAGTTPAAYAVQNVTATATGASTYTYPLASDPGTNTVPGNYADISIASQSWSAGTVTVTTDAPIGKTNGTVFNITTAGASPSGWNTNPTVGASATVTGTNTFTYALAADPGANTVPGTYGAGVIFDRVGCPKSTLHWTTTDHLHPNTPLSNSSNSGCTPRLDLTVSHIFGFYWSPTEIDYYLDQALTVQITSAGSCTGSPATCLPNNATALATVNVPLYIIASMDIANYSSGAGDPLNGDLPFAASYDIDYIRAWNLKP